MPPRKVKVGSEKSETSDKQVTAMEMAGKEESQQELPSLIRSIIREEIGAAIDQLKPQLNALKDDISVCSGKISDVEEALCNMDNRITKLETANELLRKENCELKEKADRLESHSRKYNLRVFGLTADIEKGNPTSYVESLFKELFKDKLLLEPEVENAHRVGPVGKFGNRAMIVTMQRYTVREEILRMSRKEGVLEVRGMKLRIFPDLTTDIAKKRARFREVREKLRGAGVKHGIIHPATLIITFREESKKFSDHLEAEAYLKKVIEPGLKSTK